MTCCIVELIVSFLLLILSKFSSDFFLSLLCILQFFISQHLLKVESSFFDIQIDNALLYRGITNQPYWD